MHAAPTTILAHNGLYSAASYELDVDLPEELLKGQDSTLLSDEVNKAWSTDLMAKNPGSRWITYRHNRLLIRSNKDGTGQVIFSANPAMEHLRIVPKSHPEYEKLKAEVDEKKGKKAAADKQKDDVTPEQIEAARQKNQDKNTALRYVNKEFVGKVAELVGRPELASKDVAKLETQAQALVAGDALPAKTKIDPELQKLAQEPEHQVKVAKAIEQMAQQQLTQHELQDRLGGEPPAPPTTGVPKIDQALKRTSLSQEDALAILTERDKRDEAQKNIKEYFKDELKAPPAPLAINDLQGVGITDWTKGASPAAEAVLEKALQRESSRIRATMNADFYQVVDSRGESKEAQRMAADGARSSLNAAAGQVLDGGEFGKDMLEFLGMRNASIVVASQVRAQGEDKAQAAQKDLEALFVDQAQDVVGATLAATETRVRNMAAYKGLAEDGTIAAGTAAANNARQLRELGRTVGLAAGSLEASATVIDCLRDPNLVGGDITIDGGRDLAKLKAKLQDLGIDAEKARIKPEGDRYTVRIAPEHFSSLLQQRKSAAYQRQASVAAIKDGSAREDGWRPAGSPDTVYDFKTPAQVAKMADKAGWEKYTNTPGEPGYTSQFKPGTELFRKGHPNTPKGDQQDMVKFAVQQKRAVWNAGAGLGKTYSFLAVMSELKEGGKLKDSFAVMAPPSRLRDEFFKDQEKFFPGLRVLELDKIKGLDAKRAALDKAKAGDYDVVLTGHDSVKSGTSKADVDTYATQKIRELQEERRKEGKVLGFAEVKAKRKQFEQEAQTTMGVPALLASYKPAFVGIDEAHEAFQFNEGGKGDSQRFAAIKQLASATEHFLPATGTTVRNHIGELGAILHLTRPDILKDPRKFANKYAQLGQSTGVFQGDAINDFRREFDNIMISRATTLDAKLHEKETRVQLSPEQRQAYKDNEDQYRLDRDAKGFGVIDTRTGVLHRVAPGGKLTEYDKEAVAFNPNAAVMSAAERKFLQEKGFGDPHFRVKKLGVGASARRDSLHDKALNAGDWKTNAKVQSLLQHMEKAPHEAIAVSYESKASLETLRQGLQQGGGLKPEQIVHIDGSLSGPERQAAVTKFQSDPNVKAILLSPAGRTGLNLQKIDTIYHLTRPNTHAEQVQTNARSWRTGRQGDVRAIYLDSDTPYDNNKVDTVKRKERTANTVGEYQAQDDLGAKAGRARARQAQGQASESATTTELAMPALQKALPSADVLGELHRELLGRRHVLGQTLNGLEKGFSDETSPELDQLLADFGRLTRGLTMVARYQNGLADTATLPMAAVANLLEKGLEIIPFDLLDVAQAADRLDHLAARFLLVATPDGQTHRRKVWMHRPPSV